MRIFVLTVTYELRVSRKSHLRDHPNANSLSLKVKSKTLVDRPQQEIKES